MEMGKIEPNMKILTSNYRTGLLAAFTLATGSLFAAQGPQPTICTRACWGARSTACSGDIGSLSRAIVHHTAGTGDYTTDYEAGKSKVRGIQNYHMDTQGWCDIGYHFLVNAGGDIYEGRRNSMAGLPRGAHDGCNADSFGFNVMGYYHPPYNQSFTAASRASLEAVMAWRMPSGWSAYGSGTYCSAGGVGTLDGHYKVKATACPGDGIIPQIPGIRDGTMARKNGQKPPYLFGAGTEGWTAGNGICCGLGWTATGWPGVIYGDQSAGDASFYGPQTSFAAPGESVINVSLYPQNGNTAAHDMQLFWTSSAEPFWDAAKSTPVVNYTGQNNWVTLNLDASGNGKFVGQNITRLRLDFDNVNQGNRWILNHVIVQSTLRWRFDTSTMGWTAGNSVLAPWWVGSGWPGCIVVDQTGNDASIISGSQYFASAGPYNYIGGSKDTIHVRIYPQNGNTVAHDMQVFWTTTGDGAWSESKSVQATFNAQNAWADVYLPVGDNPSWVGAHVNNLRLDFDQTNHGNRWIIDYVSFEYRP